ncbi:MAG TPA: LysM peptidoglycan-binding domain-containing M23 family metallopeptidase, partial [Polyangiales bacterium]|nr:LysM peptidoglycan-binding domain-containing M23 family metallopeptidase [Polyangiales bacterium]
IRRLRKGSQVKVPGVDKVVDVETSSDRAAAREALPALTDGAYHFLRHGESLWTLAGLYDKSVESIMERNGFTEDSTSQLREGQPIIIPGVKASQIKEGGKTPKRMGVMHEVVKGETVSDLAHTFGVSVAEIMAANGMTREEVVLIRDGQKIFLPGVEDDGRGHVKREQTPQQRRAEQIAHHLGLGSLTAAGRLLHGLIEERWIRAAGGTSTLPGTLRWPVAQGWFVRGYGSGQGGYHKAMDIMGKLGWNVRAAADGIVGYSGNQVPGFGNLVMVVHPGGWVTLYAHNSVNFVVAGEKVTRGSILAEVGSTGRSLGPHVHFEVIFDGKNCDPAPLFRPGVRHLNGKLAKLQKVMWRMPGKRPAIIQCARRQKHPIQTVEQEDPEKDKIPHADDNATETPPPGDGDEP